MKESILVFSAYPPCEGYGGPVKSIYNLVKSTSDEFDYYIISPDHDFQNKEKRAEIQTGWNRVEKANVIYVSEKEFCVRNICSWIRDCNARLVYLCSVFYYQFNFPAVIAAKKCNVPVLLAPRSDLLPNCISNKSVKKRLYLAFVRWNGIYNDVWYHSTSVEEGESILKWMRTEPNRIKIIPNICNSSSNIPRREKTQGELRMVYVGRVHPRKNLKYALECINRVKGNVTLDVYGTIEDADYWRECSRLAVNLNGKEVMRYCGYLSMLESEKIYYNYDCLFFPTLNENYGHVIAESIVAGCPVLFSKGTTPWDDYNNNGGFCFDLSQMECFVNKIETLIAMNSDEYFDLVKMNKEYAERKLRIEIVANQYINCFASLMEQGCR